MGIWDRSMDQASISATQKIFSSGYFIPAGIPAIMRRRSVSFSEVEGPRWWWFLKRALRRTLQRENRAAIKLITDASDANSAQLSLTYLQGVLMNYFQSLNPDVKVPWTVDMKSRMFYNEELKGVYMFVPGLMALILMLISALMTSVTITREKEFGTMELLLASPLKPREIILGKVTPYVLLSFVNALTIILLGFLVFRCSGGGKPLAADAGVHALYYPGPFTGSADLHQCKDTADGHVYEHAGTDASHHSAFRLYISHRQYARSTCSGSLQSCLPAGLL